MSSSFTGNPNNLLPLNYIIPEDEEEKDLKIRQYLNDMSAAVNSKSSGLFDAVETITGEQFLPTFSTDTQSNTTYRTVFRKVIDFGALPNNATKDVAHGINFSSNVSVVHFYGGSTDPATEAIPLPFSTPSSLGENIALILTPTNVRVITGSNRTNFTRTFVVVEYIKVV